MEKRYLGDAVYAEMDKFGDLVLTTEDGSDKPTNVIVLEPDVRLALADYLSDCIMEKKTSYER